jgi:AraC-like DNA-binding protein
VISIFHWHISLDDIGAAIWHNGKTSVLLGHSRSESGKPFGERSRAMLRTRFHKPAPGVEQFVRFYVQRQVQIRGEAVVHPVPARAAPMIEFIFGDPVNVLDLAQLARRKSPTAVVVGPQTYRRVEMHLQGTLESFVIMFQPDGLHRLFSIPMHELTDQDYEGHSVLGHVVSQVRERLGNSRSFEERVGLVDRLLLRQSLRSPAFNGVSATASRIIQAGGRVGISALADRAGLGIRQFERRFIQQVGMRPKLFARIARFEAALDCKARLVTKSWTDVAHEFGYYDQMHMVHDFAEFTGGTPTETLAQLETVFVEQIRTMRAAGTSEGVSSNPRLIL